MQQNGSLADGCSGQEAGLEQQAVPRVGQPLGRDSGDREEEQPGA